MYVWWLVSLLLLSSPVLLHLKGCGKTHFHPQKSKDVLEPHILSVHYQAWSLLRNSNCWRTLQLLLVSSTLIFVPFCFKGVFHGLAQKNKFENWKKCSGEKNCVVVAIYRPVNVIRNYCAMEAVLSFIKF